MWTQIWELRDFFIGKQEVTNCSRKIRDYSRDQMMLGGYKYGKIR